MELSKSVMPFIIHLGEGTDKISKGEFPELERQKLLQENTMIIHGIAFTEDEIIRIAKAKASVCWCPTSNYYLIGETFDIEAALKHNVNVVIGTDSTMSGAVNLIAELGTIREHFPNLETKQLYRMITENAVKALYLDASYGKLNPSNTRNLLLTDQLEKDPFENLIGLDMADIILLIVDGILRYGDSRYLDELPCAEGDYTIFRTAGKEKFVYGDPLEINDQIDEALGYHKDFPFLPF
jgi:cytosine/adenosine deaminase-related metal-dependent hydrolase